MALPRVFTQILLPYVVQSRRCFWSPFEDKHIISNPNSGYVRVLETPLKHFLVLQECWLRAMGAKKLCPQCKVIVTPKDLRRIYL